MTGFLIFWVACGVVAAIASGTKGRTGCGWSFLSLALGPLGFILVFALPADQRKIEQWEVEGGGAKKCPQCAEVVKREAVKCKHCGSELAAIPE